MTYSANIFMTTDTIPHINQTNTGPTEPSRTKERQSHQEETRQRQQEAERLKQEAEAAAEKADSSSKYGAVIKKPTASQTADVEQLHSSADEAMKKAEAARRDMQEEVEAMQTALESSLDQIQFETSYDL